MLYPQICRARLFPAAAIVFSAVVPALLSLDYAAPATAAVFGSDTRKPLPAPLQSLRAKIGTLVSRKSGATCTAFCVSEDAIATASHCLFGTAAAGGNDPKDLMFAIGEGNGRETAALAAGKPSADSYAIVSGTQSLAVTPPIDAGNDWAVARLAAPICRAGGLPLSEKSRDDIEVLANAGKVFEVAVHRDITERGLMLSGDCRLAREFPSADALTIARDFAEPGTVLFHTCDTGGGSSGSPLLVVGEDGPEVVAMNVGTYVLSHMVTRAGGIKTASRSEAIANTAVEVSRLNEGLTALSRSLVVRASTPQASSLLRASAPYRLHARTPNSRVAP